MIKSAAILALMSMTVGRAIAMAMGVSPINNQSIRWGPCDASLETPPGFDVQCGNLTVPLDYTDPSNSKTIDLELIKSPAKQQPAPKGSILLNFGGPGQDGLNNFMSYLPIQKPIIGDDMDIISWDPRGTRNTLTFKCWDEALYDTMYLGGWYDSSDTRPGQLWAEETLVSGLCYQKNKDIGEYLGMASVAGDIMQIVDALGEDGLLRYWGISGGTTMGAIVAAMFPDRMDKLILDGVLDAYEYVHSSVETSWPLSADNAFRGALATCIAAGEKCPLGQNKTVAELEPVMDEFWNTLKYNPIPVIEGESVINYETAKVWALSQLYQPTKYLNMSIAIGGLINKDPLPFLAQVAVPEAPAEASAPNHAVFGIRCGDKIPKASNHSELQPEFEELRHNSKWFPYFGVRENAMLCAQWKFEGKGRYEGDFRVKTKNPILWIGNTYDPVTPLASAYSMSERFEDSVVLERGGYGHVSFVRGQESNCTNDAIRKYLYDSVVPENGTFCEPNVPLHPAGMF